MRVAGAWAVLSVVFVAVGYSAIDHRLMREPFDESAWRAPDRQRYRVRMYHDVLDRVVKPGAPKGEVKARLGEPDMDVKVADAERRSVPPNADSYVLYFSGPAPSLAFYFDRAGRCVAHERIGGD